MVKHGILIILCAGLLAGTCTVGSAAEPAPQRWMDAKSLWIARAKDGVAIHYAMENPWDRSIERSLRFRVVDLDGNEYLGKSENVTLAPGRTEGTMAIPAPLPEGKFSDCFLEYRFAAPSGDERGAARLVDVLPSIETRLVAYREWLAGSRAAARVVAINHATGKPVPEASVRLLLTNDSSEHVVFEGATNVEGTIEARFDVPADISGAAELIVQVDAPDLGTDTITESVQIVRKTKILLTSDKPLYQPGQIMHIRALSLDTGTAKPVANQEMVFEVMDGKGNKVFKKKTVTDTYGVAFADFQLATEVNLGAYIMRALLGEVQVEKTLTVDRYVLPKFKVGVTTDRAYYLPGETLKGEVQADYFFGKPVAGGKVTVTLSKFEVEFTEFATIEGQLDENGHWTMESKLPDYFAGTPIEQGQASVRIEAVVVDTADHREEKVVMTPVAAASLIIHAVPESGVLQPNIENRLYVLIAYPDGAPAGGASVELDQRSGVAAQTAVTDAVGVAEFTVAGQGDAVNVLIRARDRQGRTAEMETAIGVSGTAEALLLRPEKVLYNVGETVRAEVFASKQAGTVYFDLVRDGQTMMTRTAELIAGRAALDLDLDATLSGSVVLHAYVFTPGTDLLRDARYLYVNPADALNLGITLDAETYKPGEKATIRFAVTSKDGQPAPAALGVSIVDESVFALQEIHPGLEKVYFTLEQEIMKPRFEIHGYTLDDIIVEPVAWKAEQQQAARVLLASAPEPPAPPIAQNTFVQKSEAADAALVLRYQRDLQHVQQAVTRLLDSGDKLPKAVIKTALRKRLLRDNELLDPWGTPYEFDFSNVNEWGGYFTMLSYGPDGIKGTEDDIGPGIDRWERKGIGAGAGGIRSKRMVMLDGMAVGGAIAMRQEGLMIAEAPTAAMPAELAAANAAPVRVREYFPETLLFEPALITDAQGSAALEVALADSITTWRMTTMVSAANGALGSKDAPIRVFQDFFVDIDLPLSLTQHDQVSIPVVLYNYLNENQAVRLKFEEAPWFKLGGAAEQTIELAPNEVVSRYFPIEVVELGQHKLTVYAYGAKLSDAIRREIEVRPDGEEQNVSFSDRLDGRITKTIAIPADAIDGASKILVRIYPGVFTQVVDGLDSMLQMPFGCFEQTSSVTYPNILVVQYMKETKQINPEIQMKAEGFINAGYQRLLSYEVAGGGFSWFGDAPANKVLTAWGVKEFTDMALVHEVDPAVIARTRDWLFAQQQDDGSWKPDESYLHAESWANIQNSTVLVTAYIAESLLAGGADTRIDKAVRYLEANGKETKDAYTLGILANALAAWNSKAAFTSKVIDALYALRKEDDKTAHWESEQETVTFSHGDAANVEATALAAMAFMRAGKYPEVMTKALTYLIQKKDASGTWGSTQATILALKALITALGSQTEKANATVAVRLNGEDASTLQITPEDSDVMRLIDLGEKTRKGDNAVEIAFTGEGAMLYQIVGRYYTPWAEKRPEQPPMTITVAYDKTQLAVDDLLTATVHVTNNRPQTANMIIADLGIPPGFQVMTPDLDALVNTGTIKKYEMTGRQIITYFEKIDGGKTIEFSYTLRAKYPLRAQTPPSAAYEYYNPEVRADAVPVELSVQ